MNVMNEILRLGAGNPGALNFLMRLIQPENGGFGIRIMSKILEADLKGTEIYVLFSDLCGGDIRKTAQLCDNVPASVLKDACSRQDYSGRALVAEYINQ